MFGKLFRKGRSAGPQEGKGRSDAIVALQLLDKAITSIHPESYVDPHDAASVIQPLLVNVNTLLGRPGAERFFPIDYEAVVQRLDHYRSRKMLGQMLQLAKPLPVVDALLQGTLHEFKLRHHKDQHDSVNLGKEVKSSTMTLIEFMNRCASARPESMPSR